MPALTLTRIREVLDYSPVTGVFTWKRRRGVLAGAEAGSVLRKTTRPYEGYRVLTVDGKVYRAADLAWFWWHGVWPSCQLGYRDGNRDNAALANLVRENMYSQMAEDSYIKKQLRDQTLARAAALEKMKEMKG